MCDMIYEIQLNARLTEASVHVAQYVNNNNDYAVSIHTRSKTNFDLFSQHIRRDILIIDGGVT